MGGWGPITCISIKFPGDADAVGPRGLGFICCILSITVGDGEVREEICRLLCNLLGLKVKHITSDHIN